MKREKLTTLAIAAALAFLISFGGVGCMVTGFSMDTNIRYRGVTADLYSLASCCLIFSVLAAACFSNRWGWRLTAGTAVLVLGHLWRKGLLGVSVEALVYRLSYTFGRAYGFPALNWTGEDPLLTSPDVGLCILAAVVAVAVAWTVCRRGKSIAAALAGFLPLMLCLVVTDTVPDNWSIFLLFLGMAVLILTNTVRRMSAREGNRLTALLLVPAILVTSLLFWAVPRKGYEEGLEDLQDSILNWFQELPFVKVNSDGSLSLGFSGDQSTGDVDLTAVGPKNQLRYAVMDVTASESGMLYLRGQSLDVYDGKSWRASAVSTGYDGGWPCTGLEKEGTVTISTRNSLAMQYFPYYPAVGIWGEVAISFTDGMIENTQKLREYTLTQMKTTSKTTGKLNLSSEIREQCLNLRSSTRAEAEWIVYNSIGITAGMSEQRIAANIGSYVKKSASYSLDTQKMPSSESDFALWFLKESETGYCVHFATAAVVLLRAAGVPARYVTGYTANAKAGEKVTVTAERAHAWVEYFDSSVGWVVLDPTPGGGNAASEELPGESVTPSQTEPSYTEPEDQTTAPEESTGPAATKPSDDTGKTPISTRPGNSEEPVKQKLDLSWLWSILKTLLWIVGICAVVLGQYVLRLRLRRKKMHTGPANSRVLARWREVVRMCRVLKKNAPEELLILAEKAKFSQHTMSVSERMEFDRYLLTLSQELQEKPWYSRWLIRLIWAVE